MSTSYQVTYKYFKLFRIMHKRYINDNNDNNNNIPSNFIYIIFKYLIGYNLILIKIVKFLILH